MRLIDADKLLDLIDTENQRCVTITGHDLTIGIVRSFIEHQPTNYDVDKVVEQLDKASDYYECEEQGREHVQMVNLTEAIEIVRSGGANG